MKKVFIIIVFFQTFQNINAQCWKLVEGAFQHSIGLTDDGKLWGWGYNQYGQIGSPTGTSTNEPTQIGSSTNWLTFSSNYSHTLAIRTAGGLWAFGRNDVGLLGDGTTNSSAIPIHIGTDTWKAVAAGTDHSLAIKTDGTLWGWGENSFGEVGDNSSTMRLSPVLVDSGNWKQIDAGLRRSVGIKTDGTLWQWGQSTPNNLGSTSQSSAPRQIGTDTNWKEVSINYEHLLAIKTDGTLWGWGFNYLGAVGNGIANQNYVIYPEQIGTATNWKQASAGRYNSLALKTNGALWGWGNNEDGQLGNGTNINSLVPIQVGSLTNWKFVSASLYQSLSIKNNGNMWSWGLNAFGFLGDGTNNDSNIPVFVACPTTILSNLEFETSNFKIYPNPVNNFLNIENLSKFDIISISIIDNLGRTVTKKPNDFSSIDVTTFSRGIYILVIQTENALFNYKFIKN